MKLIPKHHNKSPIKKLNWFTKATLSAAMAENPAIMTSAGWNIDSHTGDVTQDKSAFEKGAPEEKLRNSLAEISIFSPTHPLNAAFEMAPFAWRGGLYLAGKAGSKAAKSKYFATALNDAVKETNLTPALSSSSPLITRYLLPNGKIKLKLSSSTKEHPREIVLDPQGKNQYYVHTRIWDEEKIPGVISNEDKKALYEALYNELPEGGEILFPQSSSNYLGTRGTVAGLKRLSRDPRYRPGNQTGTLYFEDKNNTINTFTGTSFIKKGSSQSNLRTSLAFFERPSRSTEIELLSKNLLGISVEDFYTSLKLSVPPEYIGRKIEHYIPYGRLSDFATTHDVIPLQYVKPGKLNEQWAEETIQRLKDLGYDLSGSYEGIGLDGMYNHYYGDNTKTFENFIRENSKRKSVAGLTINRSDRVGGLFDYKNNISFVDPTKTNMSVPSIIFHERNMHGTDDVIRTLKAEKPFRHFTRDLFIFNPRVVNGPEPFLYILDSDKSLLTEGAGEWNEARATLGELKRKYYTEIRNATPELKLIHVSDPKMRQVYLDNLGKLTDNLLLEDLSNINGYGLSYAKIIRDMPENKKQEAIKMMRNILGYGALSTLPFIFTNETNN